MPWGYQWRKATESERRAGAPNSVLDVDLERPRLSRRRLPGSLGARASAPSPAGWPAYPTACGRTGQRAHEHPFHARIEDLPRPASRRDVGPVEALVTAEQFGRVQAGIADHRRVPKQASGRYLLTGLLRCPRCASRMAGRQKSVGKPARYHCLSFNLGARAPVPGCSFSAACFRVDDSVLEAVGALLEAIGTTLRADLHRAWRTLEQPQVDTGNIARVQEQAAEKARERLKRLALLYADGDLDRAGLRPRPAAGSGGLGPGHGGTRRARRPTGAPAHIARPGRRAPGGWRLAVRAGERERPSPAGRAGGAAE